ncbi:MAG: hypothetical protein O9256_00610 [Rhizobiaceae bacterium]|nr:hypothetical protein [Rhizobiaceae bacterium]
MHQIDSTPMTPEFFEAWHAAASHLDSQGDGHLSWLRADPNPPLLEHLSFRMGNQIFFIRVVDADGRVEGPASEDGYRQLAEQADGHAFEMPMRRCLDGSWSPVLPDWGLRDPATGAPINPVALLSAERIPMSLFERHAFAVQVVRDYLTEQGFTVDSWVSHPEVDPAIFFEGASGSPEWVVVRHAAFPHREAPRPDNLTNIVAAVASYSRKGHFASVAIVSTQQRFDSTDEPAAPLIRGEGMHVRFTGLEPL